MLIIVRSFSYTLLAGSARHFSFSSCRIQTGHTLFLYCSCNDYTVAIPHVMLRPNKDARARSDSSVRLTSRASHRLGKCRLSWVWLGFKLLSALSGCSACLGRGSHRHASSGFVSVQTHQTAQSWHDLVRTSVFLFFTIIVLSSEELLLHSSGHAVSVRSICYTPDTIFGEEFRLISSCYVLVRSFSYTPHAMF